jgi:UDP-N-acetylglucosamine 4-epimerase
MYYELCRVLDKDIEPIFAPERQGDIKHSTADISKAKEQLGYNPDWSFKKGIVTAIEWYKKNL